jgi:HD-GYP domain-containing protein (c-di-GMP phosphodiesterase class II)
MAIAGPMHDVGGLCIDPAFPHRNQRLSADQWRRIVVHPLLAHHVLHHERLDSFAYPRGISDEAFTLDGQTVAAGESAAREANEAPPELVSLVGELE